MLTTATDAVSMGMLSGLAAILAKRAPVANMLLSAHTDPINKRILPAPGQLGIFCIDASTAHRIADIRDQDRLP